jgi:hypothetical protein
MPVGMFVFQPQNNFDYFISSLSYANGAMPVADSRRR